MTDKMAPAITVEELIDALRVHSPSAFVLFEYPSGAPIGSVISVRRDGPDVFVRLDRYPESDESSRGGLDRRAEGPVYPRAVRERNA